MPIVIGHRGARGLEPENTLQAFEEALSLGAKGLEMDLFITKDAQVVVSHEAGISASLCVSPDGEPLPEDADERLKIYQLTYEQIRPFDCGTVENQNFPEQENTKAHIPLLSQVLETTARFSSAHAPLTYLLEVKSDSSTEGTEQPAPAFFVQQVLKAVSEKSAGQEVVIISFDKRVLQEVRKQNPAIRTGLSVTEPTELEQQLTALGFVPDVLCPLHKKLDQQLLEKAWSKGMKVFAWTVNETADLQRMADLQVDGLITDYPNRALKLLQEQL